MNSISPVQGRVALSIYLGVGVPTLLTHILAYTYMFFKVRFVLITTGLTRILLRFYPDYVYAFSEFQRLLQHWWFKSWGICASLISLFRSSKHLSKASLHLLKVGVLVAGSFSIVWLPQLVTKIIIHSQVRFKKRTPRVWVQYYLRSQTVQYCICSEI